MRNLERRLWMHILGLEGPEDRLFSVPPRRRSVFLLGVLVGSALAGVLFFLFSWITC